MNLLKKIFFISFSVFFVAAATGIFALIHTQTNLFRSEVLLNCSIDYGDKSIDSFTVSINANDKRLYWRGRHQSEIDRKRDIKNFTKTEIVMTWKSDDDEDVEFELSRLTGKFRISVMDKDKAKTESKNKWVGECYERKQRF